MKTYLSAFLLFLLLLHQSFPATAGLTLPPASEQGIEKGLIWAKRVKKGLEALDRINITRLLDLSSPKPKAPLVKWKGLSRVKDYLSNYGYLQSSGPFDDYIDQKTLSAITTYKNYFNLSVTDTSHQILLPRCAVPDMNFTYNVTDNESWPKAGNRWFPKGKNLTYGFLPASEMTANSTKVFRDSFTRWTQATGVLNLSETTYDKADIKVGFYNLTSIDIGEVVGGSIITLQPDSNVTTGYILLDSTRIWLLPSENHNLSWKDGVFDLESAAMHQIGHLLGLDHSNDKDSVMYPYILPSQQRKVQLSVSDKENFQEQYTSVNSGHRGRWGVLLFTTLSLGFAHLLLSY